MPLNPHIQGNDLGEEVILYELDLTVFGDQVYYWVAGDEGDTQSVTFRGITYTPYPISVDGFEVSAEGPLAKPSFAVNNVNGQFTPLVNAYNGLRGATFRRIRTFARFLDGGPDADPTALAPIDEYIVTRKTRHNNAALQFELSASLDVSGTMLPARQMVRDYCDKRYRVWTGSGFNYSKATCPFQEARYFDANNAPTTQDKDVCAKTLGACRLRFGQNAELPFGGFPGLGRFEA